jgi:hypothetical protein
MTEWIATKDRLPPENIPVLCYLDNEIYCGYVVLQRQLSKKDGSDVWSSVVYAKCGNNRYLWSFSPGHDYASMVTHWMPLTEPSND